MLLSEFSFLSFSPVAAAALPEPVARNPHASFRMQQHQFPGKVIGLVTDITIGIHRGNGTVDQFHT